MKRIIIIILAVLILAPALTSAAKRPISYYKNKWCQRMSGKTDVIYHKVVLDCATNDYIFIFEYSYRWRNAIGKALYYSLETGKRPGVVLIIEKPREQFYFKLMKNLISYFSLPIDYFQIGDGVSKDGK